MGALAVLALIEAGVKIAKQVTDYIHELKTRAIESGTVTPEQVAEAEAKGHAAAASLAAKSADILNRIGGD